MHCHTYNIPPLGSFCYEDSRATSLECASNGLKPSGLREISHKHSATTYQISVEVDARICEGQHQDILSVD